MSTTPDDTPDPAREPVRIGELFPDVLEELARLAEATAQHRTNQRHEGDES